MAKEEIVLYTDGACSRNPGPGGWAFVTILRDASAHEPDKELIRSSGGETLTTNNRMELCAVIQALNVYLEKFLPKYADVPVSLHTDSQYVKQGMCVWIKKWKVNGWKTASRTPVKNQDLWQKLDKLTSQVNPEWIWVKGHDGNHYNELCDALAVEAAKSIL